MYKFNFFHFHTQLSDLGYTQIHIFVQYILHNPEWLLFYKDIISHNHAERILSGSEDDRRKNQIPIPAPMMRERTLVNTTV